MPEMLPDMGSPEDWLRHAASDLAFAKVPLQPGMLVESACFHAQQVVEKSLKGVLLSLSIPFPYTHDIEKLLNFLPKKYFSEDLSLATDLTKYAVVTRYPGPFRFLNEEDLAQAIRVAERVLQWAREAMVQGKSGKATRG